ncbi:MAG: biopolymer transporter ExbD [Prevotella sp.]|nr:biopolymer transporter ExbD [Prevotella sp.]
MFERKKKRVPGLNTTSTADISFMLLIFFLVTSSMDADKGLSRQLPPPQDEKTEVEMMVKERNVLQIRIDANDLLTCSGDTISTDALTERIKTFVANEQNDPAMPEKSIRDVNYFGRCEVSDRHILSIQVDRETSYNAYFQLQNAIVKAYVQLRDSYARKHLGRPLTKCSQPQRDAIAMVYPQRISEETPTDSQQSAPANSDAQKGGKR